MTERVIAGWGVRLVEQPCGCDGRGLRSDRTVCTCQAGRRMREAAEVQSQVLTERKVLLDNQ